MSAQYMIHSKCWLLLATARHVAHWAVAVPISALPVRPRAARVTGAQPSWRGATSCIGRWVERPWNAAGRALVSPAAAARQGEGACLSFVWHHKWGESKACVAHLQSRCVRIVVFSAAHSSSTIAGSCSARLWRSLGSLRMSYRQGFSEALCGTGKKELAGESV